MIGLAAPTWAQTLHTEAAVLTSLRQLLFVDTAALAAQPSKCAARLERAAWPSKFCDSAGCLQAVVSGEL